jgi:hypothetical protein
MFQKENVEPGMDDHKNVEAIYKRFPIWAL